MKIEEKLALDILSESKLEQYQRRYSAVIRFIEIYGLIPNLERMVKDLPKAEKILSSVSVPHDLYDQIAYYENQLAENPSDKDIINVLDNLYDASYRLSKKIK